MLRFPIEPVSSLPLASTRAVFKDSNEPRSAIALPLSIAFPAPSPVRTLVVASIVATPSTTPAALRSVPLVPSKSAILPSVTGPGPLTSPRSSSAASAAVISRGDAILLPVG